MLEKFLLLLTFFIPALMTAETRETCRCEPEYLTEGDTVRLFYDPKASFLKGDIRGVYYCWENYHWVTEDMDLVKNEHGTLSASFVIPENTALVAWKFCDKDTTDIGGKDFGYARYVLDKNGKNKPSANIGWGLLRGEHTQQLAGIPSLENAGFEKKDDEVIRMWINYELRDYPQELKNVFWFATMALTSDVQKSKDNMKAIVRTLIENDGKGDKLDEEQLLKAHHLVSSVLPDSTMRIEIEKKFAERYPDGEFFREKAARELFMTAKDESFDENFRNFLNRFPPEKFRDTFVVDNMFDHYYSNLFRIYVYSPIIENNDYSRLVECIGTSPRVNLATYFWHIIQIPYMRGDVPADKLYPYATMIYHEMLSRPRTEKEKVWSPREWKEMFYRTNRQACLDYSKILDEVGETGHAMELMDTLSACFGTGNADFNDFYVSLLRKNGRNNEALMHIKTAVSDNQATPEMLGILKEEYVRNGGQESEFENYVASLKSEALMQAQKDALLKSMIDVPAELFELETLEGDRVNMADLKGHIIVLDFWATWCGPCKAAMPGMQMAVDRYKDDENVDFFFISTMENRKDFVKVIKDFMAEKGFDFQVLLDNPDDKGRRQAVYSYYAKQFHFSGIPQKMIIDGNGHVRWIATGYYGSPTALADEISIIIEEIKKEVPPKFREENIIFYGKDTLRYGATLTVPDTPGKHPAIVIASGTYPQDRDGTMAGHKIFKQMAEYLSERGIAVLRVDDRGVGESNGVYSEATTEDFADDVIAGVEYLKSRHDVDRKRLGVLGHSEGGASCSIAASKCRDIKFLISVAGLMTDGLSSVIQQNQDIVASTKGISDFDRQRYDEINDIMFRTAYEYADADSTVLSDKLYEEYDKWKAMDDSRVKEAGIEYDHFRYSIYMFAQQATTPWYRFFIRYDPAKYLSKVKVPVLAINGTKDVMVNCRQNLDNVKTYLKHNRHVTTAAIPGVNHLLLPCETGTQDEYAKITAPVSADAMDVIYNWLKTEIGL